MPPSKISDFWNSEKDFEDVLDVCEEKAKGTWEVEFVDDLRRRWENFDMDGFMSEAQYDVVLRIFNRKEK